MQILLVSMERTNSVYDVRIGPPCWTLSVLGRSVAAPEPCECLGDSAFLGRGCNIFTSVLQGFNNHMTLRWLGTHPRTFEADQDFSDIHVSCTSV